MKLDRDNKWLLLIADDRDEYNQIIGFIRSLETDDGKTPVFIANDANRVVSLRITWSYKRCL